MQQESLHLGDVYPSRCAKWRHCQWEGRMAEAHPCRFSAFEMRRCGYWRLSAGSPQSWHLGAVLLPPIQDFSQCVIFFRGVFLSAWKKVICECKRGLKTVLQKLNITRIRRHSSKKRASKFAMGHSGISEYSPLSLAQTPAEWETLGILVRQVGVRGPNDDQ